MACNCKKAAPVRKPYSERTHDEEWLYPPCQCKERADFGAYPAELQARHARQYFDANAVPSRLMGLSHARHEESAARSREMTDILSRLAELESISRNQDDVLMHAQVRLNHMHQRLQTVERHGSKVLHFGEERLDTAELKPGPVTGNAFDAPEHSNAKELPKHASELNSGAVLVTYDATVNGITERRSFRVAPGAVIEIPPNSRVISVDPEF